MLKSFKAENFRGFKKFELPVLNHINLIIGKNNVGKTALLEAMFLLMGATNPSLTFTLNQYRAFEALKLDSEEIWGWFFHHHKMESAISFKAKDDSSHAHSLKITLETPEKTQIPEIEIKDSSFNNIQENKKLKFIYQQDKEPIKETYAAIHKGSIEIIPSELVFPLSIFLPSRQPFRAKENVERFSKLQNTGEHQEVIEIMKIMEPNLKNLVVSYVGGIPNIVADLGEKILMPVNVMGDGMTYLLTVLLAVASVQNGGCLFIDEIENGLYYAVIQKVWEAIGIYSQKRNVQIIATTHSFECVRAVHEAYKNLAEYPLSVHRLEKTDNKIEVVTYDKETLGTSFELGWEIR